MKEFYTKNKMAVNIVAIVLAAVGVYCIYKKYSEPTIKEVTPVLENETKNEVKA